MGDRVRVPLTEINVIASFCALNLRIYNSILNSTVLWVVALYWAVFGGTEVGGQYDGEQTTDDLELGMLK